MMQCVYHKTILNENDMNDKKHAKQCLKSINDIINGCRVEGCRECIAQITQNIKYIEWKWYDAMRVTQKLFSTFLFAQT